MRVECFIVVVRYISAIKSGEKMKLTPRLQTNIAFSEMESWEKSRYELNMPIDMKDKNWAGLIWTARLNASFFTCNE